MDVDAERKKIAQEIQALERILGPGPLGFDEEGRAGRRPCSGRRWPRLRVGACGGPLPAICLHGGRSGVLVSPDSLPDEDSAAAGPPVSEGERWDGASNDEDDPKGKTLPEDPETCLQLNMVYQLVLQEKLAEVSLLLAQNQEQQEEVMWDLAGSKGPRVKDSKSLPLNLYVGHFLKPYFKDKVTGVVSPRRRVRGAGAPPQPVVSSRGLQGGGLQRPSPLPGPVEKAGAPSYVGPAIVYYMEGRDSMQLIYRWTKSLDPRLRKGLWTPEEDTRPICLSFLQKLLQAVAKYGEHDWFKIREEVPGRSDAQCRDRPRLCSQLPEEALLGSRLDSHDWEKISNINFEGGRSAEEIRKFWQNWEHPSINKQEWTRPELEQLKAIAAKHGHLHWQKIAEELGVSTPQTAGVWVLQGPGAPGGRRAPS
ncbi:PREDICTED: snRNA-activating protein complex subunit 4 [Myotis brandtii]|uniref:snRNA-activating protein complex subunit 4 n=1 Tax=Myotis brandtii TaxID=109478 RepID=UPI000703DF2F|nr:PREDICTED: snRNA-activating protein complex subunit 4 [Myotis brandtii]